jgi:hypothetical protein
LKRREPSDSLILLVDEVEGHLHPKWQRTILPSLLRTLETDLRVQVIATTHSPLVLASMEPWFDTERDKLFAIELNGGAAVLREQPWAMQGDVLNWLVSDSFGLEQGRSLEAERAIEAAEAWMRGDVGGLPAALSTQALIHDALTRVLPDHDSFWPRWVVRTAAADPAA